MVHVCDHSVTQHQHNVLLIAGIHFLKPALHNEHAWSITPCHAVTAAAALCSRVLTSSTFQVGGTHTLNAQQSDLCVFQFQAAGEWKQTNFKCDKLGKEERTYFCALRNRKCGSTTCFRQHCTSCSVIGAHHGWILNHSALPCSKIWVLDRLGSKINTS